MSERTATLDPGRRLPLVIAAWFAAAIVVGGSGVLGRAPILVPLLAATALVTGLIVEQRTGALRAMSPRTLIALHLVRAPIGALLLLEMSRGNLPELFALRAGPGDIVVGLAALALLGRPGRGIVVAWCVLGLADLALAVATAQYLLLVVHDPLMAGVRGLPYALLPLFAVPFLALTHVALIRRGR